MTFGSAADGPPPRPDGQQKERMSRIRPQTDASSLPLVQIFAAPPPPKKPFYSGLLEHVLVSRLELLSKALRAENYHTALQRPRARFSLLHFSGELSGASRGV